MTTERKPSATRADRGPFPGANTALKGETYGSSNGWYGRDPNAPVDEVPEIPADRLRALSAAQAVVYEFGRLEEYGPFEVCRQPGGIQVKIRSGADGAVAPEDCSRLEEIVAFSARLAAGMARPADWGRLRRMHRAIATDTEAKTVRFLELVQSALRRKTPTRATQLLASLILEVALDDQAVDEAKVAALLDRPGRKGAAAIAASLALMGHWNGHVRHSVETEAQAVNRVTRVFEQARRALTKNS